jgi:hypothetical protein
MTLHNQQEGIWAEIDKQIAYAKQHTFRLGDILLSPNGYQFVVVDVSPDGLATLHKQGSGWHREVRIAWNSPKLNDWQWVGVAS